MQNVFKLMDLNLYAQKATSANCSAQRRLVRANSSSSRLVMSTMGLCVTSMTKTVECVLKESAR